MSFDDHFASVLARVQRFNAGGHGGAALINIDLHGSGFPLSPRTPFPRWRFPQDLRAYLDEQIAFLLETWANKRGLDDDAVPSLYPRFGIAEHSAFVGGEVEFSADTSYAHPCIHDWSDLERLELRDDHPWLRLITDGLRYLVDRSAGRFAVMQRGAMAPLDLANALRGNDLFTDFYDAPEEVHRLLDFCTRACAFYIEAQRRALPAADGDVLCGCYVWMPGRSFGHLSEDASVLCSPTQYREFGRPYTTRVVAPFAHAFMHLHTAGARAFPDILSIPRIDFIELANDPNTPRGIEVLRSHRALLAGKVVKLFVTLDEIRRHLDLLREVRTVLFCTVADAAEGRTAIDLVRRELPV
jgi:hypothetical protein